MSNKPRNEKRIVPYVPTKKDIAYRSMCVQAYGKEGTTKNMKQLKKAAKERTGYQYLEKLIPSPVIPL